jgi:hypothetical protein
MLHLLRPMPDVRLRSQNELRSVPRHLHFRIALNNGHTRCALYEYTFRFVTVSGGAAQIFGERSVG